MGGRWIARSCVRSVRARERGLRQYIAYAPLCFESCSAFGHTDGLCVATPAPVKGTDVGKSLCSGALVLPHSRRRWPTKCQSHEDVVFVARAHRSRNAPFAVMELRLCIACLFSQSGKCAEQEARVAVVIA